jgi:HK97 family phage major capsid protein
MENMEIEKDAVDKAADRLEEMAKNNAILEQKMEELLKAQASMNKALIRSNEEEKEIGKTYGFLDAKKDVAMGKTAAAPYWDAKTTSRFSDYIKMVYKGDKDGIAKAFGDNVMDASNWTPTEFRSELVRLTYVSSIMLPKVTIVPMGRDKIELPKPTGALTWGFTDPGAAMADSKNTLGKLVLDAHKAYGLVLVNQEDLDDPAYPVAQYVAAQLAEDNAKFIDKVILYGDADGSTNAWDGAFDGVAEAANVQSVAGATDATPTFAKLLTDANIRAAIAKLDEQTLEGAELFFSPQGWAEVRGLKDSNGDYLVPPTAAWNYNLFGFPTNITSRVITAPAADAAAAFILNPKYIYFGDRMDMSIATSEHYRFINDQVVFRAMQRFAVAVGIPEAQVKIVFGPES